MWKYTLVCLVVTCILKGCHATSTATKCKEKEKSPANLDIAKDAISKAKNRSGPINSTACEEKEKSAAYLDIASNLISVAFENYPDCNESSVGDHNVTEILKHGHPVDCAEVLENGQNVSGLYTIWPQIGNKSLEVFCDMDTEHGGWTVIQRRGNFSVQEDFYRDWATYKKGFGNNTKDFWIGNDNIYFLTNQKNYTLRFDMESPDREKRYAEYSYFRIEDEMGSYKLHYGNYTGNAGDDALVEHSKDKKFTTKDRPNSTPQWNCANTYKGGWWYWACHRCNPNGLYQPNAKDDGASVNWLKWRWHEGLLAIDMKLKPL